MGRLTQAFRPAGRACHYSKGGTFRVPLTRTRAMPASYPLQRTSVVEWEASAVTSGLDRSSVGMGSLRWPVFAILNQ